jgi:hypothetical protein
MRLRHRLVLLPGTALFAVSAVALAALQLGPTGLYDIPALPLELTYAPGTATLEPAELQARSTGNHLTVTVILGPEGIAPGGRIELMFAAQVIDMGTGPRLYLPQLVGWPPFQDADPEAPGYVSLEPTAGPARVTLALDSRLARMRRLYHLLRGRRDSHLDYSAKELVSQLMRIPAVVSGGALPGGTKLVYHLGGPEGVGPGFAGPARETKVQVAVLIDARGSGSFQLLDHLPTLQVVGGPARRARVVVPSVVRPGEPLEAVVQAVDEHGAKDVRFEGDVALSIRGLASTWTVSFIAADRGEKRVSLSGVPEGVYWVEATGAPGVALERSIQPMVARADGPRLLWGDTHRHSVLADGYLKPEEIYRIAVEDEHLDWMCLSEHSHPDPFSLFGYYRRRLSLTPSEWMYLTHLGDRFDALEGFSTLIGYEWTSDDGHRNVYFHPSESPEPLLSDLTTDGRLSVPEFLRRFQGRQVFIIPHHPAWKLYGEPFQWGPPELADRLQRLVEVYSQHGTSEFFDNPRPIHGGTLVRGPGNPVVKFMMRGRGLSPADQAPEGSPGFVRSALASGRRMGLIASSDNHFMDGGDISYPGGLAAVWAEANDRASIWNGLNDRAAFGTSGARMILELRVAGLGIGQEGKAAGPPEIQGRVLGTAPLERVQLVRYDRNGYAVLDQPVDGERADIQRIDQDFAGPGFYYLRVEQRDGNLGWAGPIWLD